jgi:uncharacterized protein
MYKNLIHQVKYKGKKYYVYLPEKKVFFSKKDINLNKFKKNKTFLNTITFVTTNRCNFNCAYCYSKKIRDEKKLNFKLAKLCIDYINKNYWKNSKIKEANIVFRGGGEPTLNWNLIEKIVKHTKKIKKINFNYHMKASNGYLSNKQIDFIIKNKIRLAISFDGTKEFQNLNRKLKNSKNTFNKVKKTLQTFDKFNHPYAINCVITQKSINRMEEIVSFIGNNFKPLLLYFGCENRDEKPAVDLVEFSKKLIKARKYAKKFDLELISLILPFRYHEIPCPGWCILHPNGDLTSCSMTNSVVSENKFFHLGNISSDGKVNFTAENLIKFRKFGASLYNKLCKKCIACFYCGGCCPYGYIAKGGLSEKSCRAIRLVFKDYLKEIVKEAISNNY